MDLFVENLSKRMKGTKPVKKKCSIKTRPILTRKVHQPKMVNIKNALCLDVGLRDQKLLTEEVHGVYLPDGTKLNGVDIVPFEFKGEANMAWKELLSLPSYEDSESIKLEQISSLNVNAKWVNGSHPALNYRGNAIKRSKIWLQERSDTFFRYGYTGWQWKILYATACLPSGSKNLPCTRHLVQKMQSGPLGCDSNHFIVTKYETGKDNIGAHSDKTADWHPDSKFKVVKFGAPRRFQICAKDGTVLFDKVLGTGTSVTMDMVANLATTHSVPIMENIGLSGSIVSRFIKKEIDFAYAKKMVDKRTSTNLASKN